MMSNTDIHKGGGGEPRCPRRESRSCFLNDSEVFDGATVSALNNFMDQLITMDCEFWKIISIYFSIYSQGLSSYPIALNHLTCVPFTQIFPTII